MCLICDKALWKGFAGTTFRPRGLCRRHGHRETFAEELAVVGVGDVAVVGCFRVDRGCVVENCANRSFCPYPPAGSAGRRR